VAVPILNLSPDRSFLLLVDFQRPFLNAIAGGEQVLQRAKFLAHCANALGVPVFATEHCPSKLGIFDPELGSLCQLVTPKSTFSAHRSQPILAGQVVVAGVETHICVSQTVRDLRTAGHDVVVVEDAVSARTVEMHRSGLARVGNYGAEVAHSEAVVYEWLGTADHPKFREVLGHLKAHQASASID